MNESVFGIASLWIGVFALGLAAIPPIVMEKPLPFFEDSFTDEVPDPEKLEQREKRDSYLQWFTFAAIGMGLIGLVLAAISFGRENYRAFAVLGISLSTLALLWQLFLVGVAIAAIIFVVVMLICNVLTPKILS